MSGFFGIAQGVTQAAAITQQSEAQARAAEFNSEIARKNAGIQATQTEADLERTRRENVSRSGSVRAAAGASGGLTGSNLDILASNAAQQELDILNIKQQGKLREQALLQGAKLDIMEAKSTRKAGKLGSAAAILGGAAQTASTLERAAMFA